MIELTKINLKASKKMNKIKQEPYPFTIETIESMLGLTKNAYSSVTYTPFNNGGRYVFSINQILNLTSYYEEYRKKMIKIMDKYGYYVKVFEDNRRNLNIIVTKKSKFYKDGKPVISKNHIINILGVNEYEYNNLFVHHNLPKVQLSIYPKDGNRYNEASVYSMVKKLKKVFEYNYVLEVNEFANNITFEPKDDAMMEFDKVLERILDDNIRPLSKQIYDRIQDIKNKTMTLEERCEVYKQPVLDNSHLDVAKQLENINNMLKYTGNLF